MNEDGPPENGRGMHGEREVAMAWRQTEQEEGCGGATVYETIKNSNNNQNSYDYEVV